MNVPAEDVGLVAHGILHNERLKIATFDADVAPPYNQGNCNIARDFFQNSLPKITVSYWCEAGRESQR